MEEQAPFGARVVPLPRRGIPTQQLRDIMLMQAEALVVRAEAQEKPDLEAVADHCLADLLDSLSSNDPAGMLEAAVTWCQHRRLMRLKRGAEALREVR